MNISIFPKLGMCLIVTALCAESVAQECNWYGADYPLCSTATSGWGWENNQSCIATSTCAGQPDPYGVVGSTVSSEQASSPASSTAVASSSESSASATSPGECNWYDTRYPLCVNASGWGWENNLSCVGISTCNSLPTPYGIVSAASSSSIPAASLSSSSSIAFVSSSSQSTASTGANRFVVRALGTQGDEQISLSVGGNTVGTWTLSTSMANYTVSTDASGEILVEFINDASGRDVQVDYIQLNGSTREAEDQGENTGVWANESCGGTDYAEWLHCGGYIHFGDTSGIVVQSSSSTTSSIASGACGAGNPDVTVTGSPGNYSVNGQSAGSNYYNAIISAIESAPNNGRVAVMADGAIGDRYIDLPSNITFEVCGSMDVGNVSGRGAIQAISKSNVSIPYLKMTGSPYFGLRFADIDNLHLGQIELRFNGGLGIRFDRDLPGSTNVSMDYVYVSGTDNHGVETWNVDGLEIGTIVARDVAYAGLLLNNTRNAHIGLVDGNNVATGTGYATLRFANENGSINGSYPINIYVDKVISRGGGRGLFCVSQSGGAEIENIDFADNGNNAILIENCYNVKINSGTINGGGEVRIAARSEFANTRDITFSNLNITGTSVRESPCGDNVNWINVNVQDGSYNVCN